MLEEDACGLLRIQTLLRRDPYREVKFITLIRGNTLDVTLSVITPSSLFSPLSISPAVVVCATNAISVVGIKNEAADLNS